ncbi:hypothetical protein HMI55_000818 [Coelomomyces lativittatus]|nr:hypothetical protein HMI55_000818 [Coelomomyces lativittatus]KAJ1507362.1 hypothetical protein HMI56_000135 [Coelomomyces lativittatus]
MSHDTPPVVSSPSNARVPLSPSPSPSSSLSNSPSPSPSLSPSPSPSPSLSPSPSPSPSLSPSPTHFINKTSTLNHKPTFPSSLLEGEEEIPLRHSPLPTKKNWKNKKLPQPQVSFPLFQQYKQSRMEKRNQRPSTSSFQPHPLHTSLDDETQATSLPSSMEREREGEGHESKHPSIIPSEIQEEHLVSPKLLPPPEVSKLEENEMDYQMETTLVPHLLKNTTSPSSLSKKRKRELLQPMVNESAENRFNVEEEEEEVVIEVVEEDEKEEEEEEDHNEDNGHKDFFSRKETDAMNRWDEKNPHPSYSDTHPWATEQTETHTKPTFTPSIASTPSLKMTPLQKKRNSLPSLSFASPANPSTTSTLTHTKEPPSSSSTSKITPLTRAPSLSLQKTPLTTSWTRVSPPPHLSPFEASHTGGATHLLGPSSPFDLLFSHSLKPPLPSSSSILPASPSLLPSLVFTPQPASRSFPSINQISSSFSLSTSKRNPVPSTLDPDPSLEEPKDTTPFHPKKSLFKKPIFDRPPIVPPTRPSPTYQTISRPPLLAPGRFKKFDYSPLNMDDDDDDNDDDKDEEDRETHMEENHDAVDEHHVAKRHPFKKLKLTPTSRPSTLVFDPPEVSVPSSSTSPPTSKKSSASSRIEQETKDADQATSPRPRNPAPLASHLKRSKRPPPSLSIQTHLDSPAFNASKSERSKPLDSKKSVEKHHDLAHSSPPSLQSTSPLVSQNITSSKKSSAPSTSSSVSTSSRRSRISSPSPLPSHHFNDQQAYDDEEFEVEVEVHDEEKEERNLAMDTRSFGSLSHPSSLSKPSPFLLSSSTSSNASVSSIPEKAKRTGKIIHESPNTAHSLSTSSASHVKGKKKGSTLITAPSSDTVPLLTHTEEITSSPSGPYAAHDMEEDDHDSPLPFIGNDGVYNTDDDDHPEVEEEKEEKKERVNEPTSKSTKSSRPPRSASRRTPTATSNLTPPLSSSSSISTHSLEPSIPMKKKRKRTIRISCPPKPATAHSRTHLTYLASTPRRQGPRSASSTNSSTSMLSTPLRGTPVRILEPVPPTTPIGRHGRPQRHRVPRIAWWKGEKIEYTRQISPQGTVSRSVTGIVRVHEPDLPSSSKSNYLSSHAHGLKKKKTHTQSTSKSSSSTSFLSPNAKRASIKVTSKAVQTLTSMTSYTDPENETDPSSQVLPMDTMIPVLYYPTLEEKLERITYYPSLFNPTVAEQGGFRFQRIYSDVRFFSAGVLELQPGQEKPKRTSGDNIFMYIVHQGTLDVAIHVTEFKVGPGCGFIIPRGNLYRIHNVGSNPAIVYFASTRLMSDHPKSVGQGGGGGSSGPITMASTSSSSSSSKTKS